LQAKAPDDATNMTTWNGDNPEAQWRSDPMPEQNEVPRGEGTGNRYILGSIAKPSTANLEACPI
jgi:hypothetical protein